MAQAVAEQVIAILAAQALCVPEAIDRGQALTEIGLDSLGVVESLFAIEERFDISVPFNPHEATLATADLPNVAGLIHLVEALIAQKAS